MSKESPPHRDAVCPRLKINDLFLFHDLFQGLRNRRAVTEIADELKISRKKCYLVLRAVEEALALDGEGNGFIRRHAEDTDVDLTPGGIFHAVVKDVIERLASAIDDCQARRQRVVVQGSEFSTMWLLPRVLEKSRFLQEHPGVVLDIRRAFWKRFIANLERDRIDLALGPAAPHWPQIEQQLLLTVPRALIFHKDHRFAAGKDVDLIKFRDLSRETVFVLSGDAIPGLHMKRCLPKPSQGGRHVYLDSISHMYQYVQRDLGVALGYVHRYGPAHERSLVLAKSFPEIDTLPPAAFYLYVPRKEHRKLSPDAEAFIEAILQVSPTL
jgi:DNA-binding transcriptional LysR family regulator